MSMYADNIIDLYKHPLNQGALEHPSTTYRAYSPLCGDDITVDMTIDHHTIQDIRHRGIGCAISQASVSLLTEDVKGKQLHQVMEIVPEEVVGMLGIELGPVRLKCALLGLEAIHEAIWKYQKIVQSF